MVVLPLSVADHLEYMEGCGLGRCRLRAGRGKEREKVRPKFIQAESVRYGDGGDGGDGAGNYLNDLPGNMAGASPQSRKPLGAEIVKYSDGAVPVSRDNQAKNTSGTPFLGNGHPSVRSRRGSVRDWLERGHKNSTNAPRTTIA